MPGMIGLACGELARYSDVIPALMGLDKPPGTLFMKASALGPAEGFNAIAEEVLKRGLDWLFLVNDDNIWDPDIIKKFLSYNVDVVGGFYLTRTIPFNPVAFDRLLEPHEIPETHDKTARFYHRYFPQVGDYGLKKVVATGDGGLLIRSHVLEAIKAPRWEYGETRMDVCDHDMVFSRKVREAGFSIYVDLETCLGHIATAAIKPIRNAQGVWNARVLQVNGDRFIELPFAEPVK